MIKKILFFLVIIPYFFSVSLWWFCEQTSMDIPEKEQICYSSPDFLENYLSNVIWIISKSNVSSKNGVDWLTWLWAKALQTPIWAFVVASHFATSWLWNFFQNFLIIFEDTHIVRDWTKLINFKQYLSNYFLNAGWNAILFENIDNFNSVRNIIVSSDYFLIKFSWIEKYWDLFKYIWKNQVLLEKIYFDIVKKWDFNYDKVLKKFENSSNFELNKQKIDEIVKKIKNEYYINWIKIECDSTWDEFIFAIHNIVCNVWAEKTNEAVERFQCNYDRLKSVLWFGWSVWNCGSVKQKDWISLNERVKIDWLGQSKEELKELWKVITKKIPWKVKAGLNELFLEKQDFWKDVQIKNVNNVAKIWEESFINDIVLISEKIIEDKNQVNSAFVRVEPWDFTHNTTILFPQISKKIYDIIDKIESNVWVLENTSTACENQSPFGKKCRPSWN